MHFDNGEALITYLVQYIQVNYTKVIDNKNTTLGNHITSSTAFGVGIFINDKPFIASWDPWNNQKNINNHDQDGYLEADFSGKCLNSLHPSQTRRTFNLNTTRDMLNYEETKSSPYASNSSRGIDFVRNIIYVAAKTGVIGENTPQTISDTSDTAVISQIRLTLDIKPKEDLNKAKFQTPFTYGSDRVSMSTVTIGVPGNRIDIESDLKGLTQPNQPNYLQPSHQNPRFQQHSSQQPPSFQPQFQQHMQNETITLLQEDTNRSHSSRRPNNNGGGYCNQQ